MNAPRALFLTGSPGIGKTTVIRRVAERLRGSKLGGFYTEEVRETGERHGFQLVGFDGTVKIIAHVGFSRVHRVGKYGVDVRAIDEAAGLLAPDLAAEIYLVDEIGKMECLSERFVAGIRTLLSGSKPVVATVALHGSGFIAEVKRAHSSAIWKVTHVNRDILPLHVLDWLEEAIQHEA